MRAAFLGALLLSGCLEPSPSIRDAGARDSGHRDGGSRSDAGSDPDAGDAPDAASALDAGTDAAMPDAGADASMSDAGGASIVVDGVLAAGEWDASAMVTNGTASDWGPTLNRLDALYLEVDETYVNVAITGAVEEMNGIVLYIDGHDGAGVCDLSTLTDSTGAVDDRLSAAFVTPSTFCADVGWSTRYMDRSAGADDPDMGFRDLDSGDPADFGWVPVTEAPTVCGPTVCEARIPRAALGVVSGETVSVFARLGNQSGTGWSNQTLPEDSPPAPQAVGVVLDRTAP